MKTKYTDRTPDSIRQEMNEYTEKGVEQLAKFLQCWMGNEHNARHFVQIAKEKELGTPAERAKVIFSHAYDWFAYGN